MTFDEAFEEELALRETDETTPERAERTGTRRQAHLARMRKLPLFIVVVSVGAMIVGTVLMTTSDNTIFNINTAGAAGLMCVLSMLLAICFVSKARDVPLREKFPKRVQCMCKCATISMIFAWIGLFIGLGFGGIWAIIECQKNTERNDPDSMCAGDSLAFLVLAAFSFALVSVIILAMSYLTKLFCSNRLGWENDGRFTLYVGRDLQPYGCDGEPVLLSQHNNLQDGSNTQTRRHHASTDDAAHPDDAHPQYGTHVINYLRETGAIRDDVKPSRDSGGSRDHKQDGGAGNSGTTVEPSAPDMPPPSYDEVISAPGAYNT